jgi:hypothetical protein
LDAISIAGDASATQIVCTTSIRGILLPMVIDRVLDPSEIARLHEEQRSNPWVLFAERPIWVPMTAPAPSFKGAWVPRAYQVIGAR